MPEGVFKEKIRVHLVVIVQRKIRTRLDLLSILQSGGKTCLNVKVRSKAAKNTKLVVDSHIIQRIDLATEETTVTQQVSHRPIK